MEDIFARLYEMTAFSNIIAEPQFLIMYAIAFILLYLGIKKKYEPLLLIPIAFGVLLANFPGGEMGVVQADENGMVMVNGVMKNIWEMPLHEIAHDLGLMNFIYYMLIKTGFLPPIIFMGVGALTDFGPMLRNLRLSIFGAAAQLGIFTVLLVAILMGFTPKEAASLGIIGGADGPTAIFTTIKLAPHLLGPIAIAAYSYMALVPVIIPLVVKLWCTKKELSINMKEQEKKYPSKTEIKNLRVLKILFPIVVTTVVALFVPSAVPLIGMLMFGNLVKEIGSDTSRLFDAASNSIMNAATIFLGLSVGATMTTEAFLNWTTIGIVIGGFLAFALSISGGILFVKIFNLFTKKKINPLIGACGLSAVPMASRVANEIALKYDPKNHVLQYCMASNISGVIGSAFSAVVKGEYGTLILNNDGTYSYVLDYEKCHSLGEGVTETDQFTVKVSNGAGEVTKPLTVTIHGVNDLPVVTVTPALSVQEGLPPVGDTPNPGGMATGKVDAHDVDAGDTLSYGIMVGDTFVAALPETDDASETPATVYVVGTWGDDGELTLSTTTQAPDAQSLVGTLTMNASGEYTFTVADSAMAQSLNGGKSAQITVQVGATDNHGEAQTKPVTITIHGTNEAPEVSSSLQTSEDAMVEVTGGNQITFTPNDTTSDSGYTVTDADRGDTLTYTFEQRGRYFTSSDAVISINGKDYTVSLSIGADGKITMTYGDDVKKAINALGEGETATLNTEKSPINLVVQDGFGGKTSSPLTLSVSGENDAVVIPENQNTANIEIVDGAASLPDGSFTFTDVDVNDKHEVTLPETVQVTLPGENPQTAQVDTETGVVTLDGIKLGTLTINPVQEPANGKPGKVTYTFDPDAGYLTGLGTGEEVKLDLTFKVTELNNGVTVNTVDQTVTVTLTGSDNATAITGTADSFTVSDADITDVTSDPTIAAVQSSIDGLTNASTSLTTDEDGTKLVTVSFTNAEGTEVSVTLGTLVLTKDESDSWSCVFTPDASADEQLPFGATVNITGVTVQVTTEHSDDTASTVTTDLSTSNMNVAGSNVMELENAAEGSIAAGSNVSGVSQFDLAKLFKNEDKGGDALRYTWNSNPYVQAVSGATGVFMLTEAGLLAFAQSVAAGETFSVPLTYTVTDGLNRSEQTFTLTLDDADVQSVTVGGDVWRFGDADANSLAGGTGNDMLFGMGGGDTLYGGDGNDVLFGDGETAAPVAQALGLGTHGVSAEAIGHGVASASSDTLEHLVSAVDSVEGSGNDMLFGMGGDGNDIVVYDGNDYLIDGGSGIDFIVSNDDSLSLNDLLTKSGRNGNAGPMVNGVEVLIKGEDALSLTSMDQLSKDYGVTIGHDAQGNETLTLNADQWHANGDGSFDYVGQPGVDLTLETSLTPVTHDDAADAAVQQQVFILQNTQG